MELFAVIVMFLFISIVSLMSCRMSMLFSWMVPLFFARFNAFCIVSRLLFVIWRGVLSSIVIVPLSGIGVSFFSNSMGSEYMSKSDAVRKQVSCTWYSKRTSAS